MSLGLVTINGVPVPYYDITVNGVPGKTLAGMTFVNDSTNGPVAVGDKYPMPVSGTLTLGAGSAAIGAVTVTSGTVALSAGSNTIGGVNLAQYTAGQQNMAGSLPVVIASNQTGVPVTGTFWQATQPVSAASLPLPTGAATAANQAAEIASLASIVTNTGNIPAPVNGGTPVSAVAGEAHWGEVGGNSATISPSLGSINSGAYSAGMSLGGVLTLASAMRKSGGTGLFQSMLVIDPANQRPNLDVYLFNQNPVNGTYGDHTTPTWNATDEGFIIRRVSVTQSDWVAQSGLAVADLAAISRVVAAVGSANLYALILIGANSTPTFGTNTPTIRFGFLRD